MYQYFVEVNYKENIDIVHRKYEKQKHTDLTLKNVLSPKQCKTLNIQKLDITIFKVMLFTEPVHGNTILINLHLKRLPTLFIV